jgi:hypothetical protein
VSASTKYTKLATAKTVVRIQAYVNEYFYSTGYRVDLLTLEISNATGAVVPAGFFVQAHRGGYLFGRRT